MFSEHKQPRSKLLKWARKLFGSSNFIPENAQGVNFILGSSNFIPENAHGVNFILPHNPLLSCLFSYLQGEFYYGPAVNKGIGDAGSTADFRMLWSAMVCPGLI